MGLTFQTPKLERSLFPPYHKPFANEQEKIDTLNELKDDGYIEVQFDDMEKVLEQRWNDLFPKQGLTGKNDTIKTQLDTIENYVTHGYKIFVPNEADKDIVFIN